MTEPTVFVIDDDPLLGEAFVQALKLCGFDAEHIIDSTKALQRIIDEQPVFVVLDLQMPKMDGTQVLEAMRASGATAQTKVVVVTANRSMLTDAVREMAHLVLHKPVSLMQIREVATRMVAHHRASEDAETDPDQN